MVTGWNVLPAALQEFTGNSRHRSSLSSNPGDPLHRCHDLHPHLILMILLERIRVIIHHHHPQRYHDCLWQHQSHFHILISP